MGKKTIRIENPINKPEEFAKLLGNIVKQNTKLGNASPLKNNPKVDMANFDTKRMDADTKRANSEDLREQSEAAMMDANMVYGRGKGQSIDTPGTLYNGVDIIKEILLVAYKGSEETLSEWGFDVVIGTAKSPTKKPK